MKVLLVGSNPSIKSPDLSPFHSSTRSRIIIDGWFKDIDAEIHFINVCDRTRPGNRPLCISEIKESLPLLRSRIRELGFDYGKIVALGKTADKALSLLEVEYLSMPHPSGLNRQLNDPEFVASKIKELKKFIYGRERQEDNRISKQDS